MKTKVLTILASAVVAFGLWFYVISVEHTQTDRVIRDVEVTMVGAATLERLGLGIAPRLSLVKSMAKQLRFSSLRQQLFVKIGVMPLPAEHFFLFRHFPILPDILLAFSATLYSPGFYDARAKPKAGHKSPAFIYFIAAQAPKGSSCQGWISPLAGKMSA